MEAKSTDEIIEQIKKIVRLARKAGTDGERIAAENAAKRLADKAGVALENLEVTEAEIKTGAFQESGTIVSPGKEMSYALGILATHFGVYGIQYHIAGRRNLNLIWIGTRINVDIARHVFHILLRESSAAWRLVRTVRGEAKKKVAKSSRKPKEAYASADDNMLVRLSAVDKRNFLRGWFYKIHLKLLENPLRNDTEQFEAEKKSAKDFLDDISKRNDIKERTIDDKKTDEFDRDSYVLGACTAEKVNLSRPVNGTPTKRPAEVSAQYQKRLTA